MAVAKLDRLSRDVHFISGLMSHRVPFVVAEPGTTLTRSCCTCSPLLPRREAVSLISGCKGSRGGPWQPEAPRGRRNAWFGGPAESLGPLRTCRSSVDVNDGRVLSFDDLSLVDMSVVSRIYDNEGQSPRSPSAA